MTIRFFRLAACVVAASLPCLAAHAQIEGLLNKGGGMKGLEGSLSGQSLASGSMGNVAGLLQFCVTNNYLGGENTNPVQEKLMNKLPGGTKSNDPGYTDGLKGLLHAKDGKQLDLGGGGVQAQLSKQVCDAVLSQAKSLL
ncbi:MAG: DUF2501 domain-containing protein [Telluria sp.]